LGRTVVDAEGNRLGAIKNVALDLEQGRIAYAIVSAGGGDLGVNTRTIAVPWTALRSSPAAENGAGSGAKAGGVVTGSERIILDMTSARLKEAPAFDENDWSTLTNERTAMGLHTFYGVQPYWGSGAGMGAGRGRSGAGGEGREGMGREGTGRAGAGTGRETPTGREGEGTGTGTGGTGESGTGQGGREQPGTGSGTGEGNRERPGTGERGTGGRGREGSGRGGRSGGSGTGSGGGRSGAGGSGSGGSGSGGGGGR
jgi:hypothetical protein